MSRIAAVAAALVAAVALAAPAGAAPGLPGFARIQSGPDGGAVWQGVIPNALVPGARRPSVVYLPPGFSPSARYPVVYLLHGLPGSPYSYTDGLRLAAVADGLISSGALPPFVAVLPVAGTSPRYNGEWTGPWENFVVHDVVPWVDAHLPTIAGPSGRAIAGFSAGGFGAVDIGLRHPSVFGTLESWSGYFAAPRDGTLARMTLSSLGRYDPSLLVRGQAPALRAAGTRFFLSSGTTLDRRTAAATIAFAQELAALRLPHRLWLAPGGHDGRLWRAQLPAALAYALGR